MKIRTTNINGKFRARAVIKNRILCQYCSITKSPILDVPGVSVI